MDVKGEFIDLNDLKRQYADTGLLKGICEYTGEKNKFCPMHLYVTLAGVLGCTIGSTSDSKEEVEIVLRMVIDLLHNAAEITWDKKGDNDDGVSKLPN